MTHFDISILDTSDLSELTEDELKGRHERVQSLFSNLFATNDLQRVGIYDRDQLRQVHEDIVAELDRRGLRHRHRSPLDDGLGESRKMLVIRNKKTKEPAVLASPEKLPVDSPLHIDGVGYVSLQFKTISSGITFQENYDVDVNKSRIFWVYAITKIYKREISVRGDSVSKIKSAINSGNVNKDSSWSFSNEDGNKLLGDSGDDWDRYANAHLAQDTDENAKTKARYKYPVAKLVDRTFTVFESGLDAAAQRAGQSDDGNVLEAAQSLSEELSNDNREEEKNEKQNVPARAPVLTKPPKVERCVRSILEENPEMDESTAWAICTDQMGKGCNKKVDPKFKLIEKEDESNIENQYIKFLKRHNDQEKRLVYGIVLEPNEVDAQNDTINKAEIESAAHFWMLKSQRLGLMHQEFTFPIFPVESYIAPIDFDKSVFGEPVKKGSWILVSFVPDDEVWDGVKQGRFRGYSIGALGERHPVRRR